MSNFNFTSQVCTSRSQSERLLALGLKKETADMVLDETETIVLSWFSIYILNGMRLL